MAKRIFTPAAYAEPRMPGPSCDPGAKGLRVNRHRPRFLVGDGLAAVIDPG
jgi:hypothetical protein